MIKIVRKMEPGLIEKLVGIYSESIANQFQGESDFRDFCYESLTNQKCIIFLLSFNGEAVSSVFSEKISDNSVLLYSLETASDFRRKGYAQLLLSDVQTYFEQAGTKAIYVHIQKDNRASLDLHRKLGFSVVKDTARLLDGTVSHQYYTLSYQVKAPQ